LITGDNNNNNWLDTNETWIYQATTNPTNNITNTANITAEDPLHKKVYSEDTATVTVINIDINVTKTANITQGHPGDIVNYTIVVTNTGDNPLYDVYVNDTTLGISYYLASLGSGANKTYYVEHILTLTPDPFINTVYVEGYDQLGAKYTDSDDAIVYIIKSPDISVEKYVRWDCTAPFLKNVTAERGQWVTFKIYINNTGETPLTITAKDVLPSGLIYNYTETPYGYNYTDGANYYWNFTNIVNGTTIIIQYVVDIENCGFFENVINVTGIYEDQTVTAEDTATVYGLCPGINIVKDVNRSIIHPGETVTYTYTITNTGNCNLTNLIINDDKIPTINYINGDTNNNNWLDTNETWTYQATTNPTNNITNTANITAEDQLGKKVYDRDTTTVTVIHPDIKVVKTVSPNKIHSGDTVTYNITVTNTGDCILIVNITDNILGIIATGVTLPAGSNISYHPTSNPTEDVTNTVNATGTDELGKKVYDEDTATVTVINTDINVTKTANITQGHPGDIVNYTIVVTNIGEDALYNVWVNDTTLDIHRYVGYLDDSYIFYVEHILTSNPDPFINTVNAEGYDELGMKYSSFDTTNVDIISPNISVVKTVSPEIIHSGEPVTWNITVTNTGDVTLHNIYVIDTTGTLGSMITLAPDEKWYYEYVTNPTCNIINTVDVNGTDPLGREVNDFDTAEVNVISPSIHLDKTVNKNLIHPGETVTYTYTVTNTGNCNL
ncbi:MAG: hypothetical protein DRP09_20900, partial [Candidatus Thorarchaeota archaeon]